MTDRTVFADLFRRTCRAGVLCLMLSALAALGGCAGQTARMDLDSEDDALLGAMSSKDFRAACFQMAQSLIRLPQIQNAANPPTLAFTEVVNASDELFSTDDLLYKIRTELIKNCGGKILFLDRDIIDQIRTERRDKDLGKVTTSGSKPVYGADLFMSGRVESIRRSRGREQTQYMRLSVRLTDASSSAILWENDYELKKLVRAGVYDR